MQPLRVLAAGSLRPVWSAMAEHFRNEYPPGIETQFGPAGLLRQRIEQGESCDLFASANLAHPQALRQSGRALQVAAFCRNSLCLNVRRELGNLSWLQLLQHPQLRIATSTAGSDPCGDYAWQMFDRLALWDSELGGKPQAARPDGGWRGTLPDDPTGYAGGFVDYRVRPGRYFYWLQQLRPSARAQQPDCDGQYSSGMAAVSHLWVCGLRSARTASG